MSNPRVLIVGAGPVGIVSAVLLAQRGVESIVVDRYSDPYALPRAVHIDDEVFRILQQVGIADRFAAVSRPMPGMRLLDANYRTMAEFPRSTQPSSNGYPQANFFDQPDLERILREEVARWPGIEVRGRTEFLGFEQLRRAGEVTAVRVTCRDVDTGKSSVVEVDALLGCDGANSSVRAALGAQLVNLGYEERWCVIDGICTRELPVWSGMYQVCDPQRATTFGRIGAQRYRWEFQLKDGETVEDLLQPERLRALVTPVLGDVPFEDVEFIRSAQYTFRAAITDRWHEGRVFLAGDAAHLTPPFVGQGLCAGIRDAANLTWKLARVLRDGASEELLATYEPERSPHVRTFIRLAMTVGWAMTGGQDRAAAVRKGMLGVATRIPGFTSVLLSQTAPALPGGPLVQRSRRRRAAEGRMIPQPTVNDNGHPRRFDEVLGDGFAVVVTSEPSWDARYLARRLGAPVVGVGPTPMRGTDVRVDDAHLHTWLGQHGLGSAVVRPDRIVLTGVPAASGERLAEAGPWLDLVESTR